MANYEATKYDYSGASIQGLVGITTGSVIPWSDASIPSGFLECNGAAVSRSTYATLFSTIGTTYGSGNGSTTFNVPDFQDNVVVGKSPNKALASTGGANTVTATGTVGGNLGNTTISTPLLPSHNHAAPGIGTNQNVGGIAGPPANPYPRGNLTTAGTGGGGAHSHGLSANFTGDATSVLQPYLTVIYIIKT